MRRLNHKILRIPKESLLNGIDQLLTNTIHQNPAERHACAKAMELAATSKHFESVLQRFVATSRGKIEKNDSPVMKVIFGSAMTERENFKCTAFLVIKRLLDLMVLRKEFKMYLRATQFLVESAQHSELDTWRGYLDALAAAAKCSRAAGIEFMGRNSALTLLCKELLPHSSYKPLQARGRMIFDFIWYIMWSESKS